MESHYSVADVESSRTPDLNNSTQNEAPSNCNVIWNIDNIVLEEQTEAIKIYLCKYPRCDKSFRYRSEINRHMVTHTNMRPYACPYKDCHKSFKRSDALATHIRIHTRDKPFPCPSNACEATFTSKAGLKYHASKHNCDNSHDFSTSGLRERHLDLQEEIQRSADAMIEESSQKPMIIGYDSGRSASYANVDHLSYSKGLHPVKDGDLEARKQEYFGQPRTTGIANYGPSQPFQQFSLMRMNLKTSCSESVDPDTIAANSFANAFINRGQNQEGLKHRQAGLPIQDPTIALRALLYEHPDEKPKVFKVIKKILDENDALKRRLEDCQNMIRNYQSNIGMMGQDF